jgi:flagellar biosynthesis/type III secretory pathway M-ring protein FliF/YscJ
MSRKSKKQWSDLSAEQRAAIIAAGTFQLSLHAAALVDLRRRPRDQVNGSKPLWVALSFVNFIGPLAYFAFGRRR